MSGKSPTKSNKSYALLIEDDEAVAETIALVLEHEGIPTRWAKNLTAARATFDAFRPRVILLDYVLNGETPEEFVKYIQTTDSVPIILVTAVSQSEALAEVLKIKSLLRKPFELQDLLDDVRPLFT